MSGAHAYPSESVRSTPPSPTYAQALISAHRPTPINTNVRYGSGVSATGILSSGQSSNDQGPTQKIFTPATSLYPPSIWSPIAEATQSATMPNKLSWEQSLALNSFKNIPAVATPLKPQESVTPTPKTIVGLGFEVNTSAQTPLQGQVQAHTNAFPNLATPIAKTPTAYQFQQSDIFNAQTSPYNRKAADPNANSYPLPQFPFGSLRDVANQPRILPKLLQSPVAQSSYNVPIGSEREASANHEQRPVPVAPNSDAVHPHGVFDSTKRPDSAIDRRRKFRSHQSVHSEISASKKDELPTIELLEQESHPKGFHRFMRSNSMPSNLDAGYPGGYIALKSVNSDQFQLPSNARVICIKTEFITNIHWAVKRLAWAAMEKVGQRIMRVWDECQKDGSRVFLLMSINGQKSYCGLAEMTGGFTKGGDLDGWMFSGDRSIQWGIMPLTWHFIKNVSYSWFADIHHSHNDGPIINMWNGMHFPGQVGHEVIKRYAKRPHFTNVLCWDRSGPYFPMRGNTQPEQIDPTLGPIRGPKGGRAMKPAPTELLIEASNGADDRVNATTPTRPANADMTVHSGVQATPHHSGRILTTSMQVTPVQATPVQATRASVVAPPGMYSNGHKAPRQNDAVIGVANQSTPNSLHRRKEAVSLNKNLTPSPVPAALNEAASPSPRPGEFVTCIVDAKGNYVPVTAGGHQVTTPGFPLPSVNTPQTVFYHHSHHGYNNHFASPNPQLYDGKSPTPMSVRGRGGARGRGGSRSNLGRMYSPASSVGVSSGSGSFTSQQSLGLAPPPAILRMQSHAGLHDVFSNTHSLRQTFSNPSISTPSRGQGTAIFQQAALSANCVQQSPQSPHPGSGTNFTGIAARQASASTAASFNSTVVCPQVTAFNQPSPVSMHSTKIGLHGCGVAPPRVSKAPSGSQMSFPSFTSNDYDAASVSTEDTETKLYRARLMQETQQGLQAAAKLAAMDYRRDPRRSHKHGEFERFEGSEPGGLACFVSDSSMANKYISPLASVRGSVWKGEKNEYGSEMAELEKRVQGDVDRLCASPPSTVAGGSGQGTLLDFDGEGMGGVRL